MDLKKNAPKGEFLAYINKKEATMLKKAGGSGKLVNGIPSFRPQDMGNQTNQDKSAANPGAGGGQRTGTTSGRHNPHTDTGYSNSNYKNEKVTGATMRDHANAFKIGVSQPKTIPAWMPGGTQAKFLKTVFGTPKTKFGKKSISAKRMAYINSLPPASRKAMIDRLGLGIDPIDNKYGDPTILGSGDYGENLYGIDALDIINFNGDYMKQYGPKTIEENDGNPNILPQYAMMGGGADMGSVDVEEEKTFDYHLGKDGQGIGRDVTLGYLAKGGRAGKAEGGIMELRARRAFGGIMDRVTGRKAYGLGSIFKSVKKAVGKVLKSDIGKAAIIGAGIYYGGGGNLFGMQRANAAGFGKAVAGKSFFGQGLAGALRSGAGSMFTKLPENATFMDKAMKFGKFGLLGLGLGLSPLGKAKPNEDSYADRGGHLIDPITGQEALPSEMRASLNNALDNADGDPIRIKQINDAYAFLGPDERLGTYSPYRTYGVKDGGRIGKAEGGLMDLGGMEKDYRAEGGFVPIGEYEKKDDVPARLSVNEFVFTADAVRGAGGGDIDKGAEIMENMMVNLEKGGTVSEESQGNAGAQQMFNTSERLGEVI
jgi:hypothetical protein